MSSNVAIVITGNAQPFVQATKAATQHAQQFAHQINNIRVSGGGGGASAGGGLFTAITGGAAGGAALAAFNRVTGLLGDGLGRVAAAGYEAGRVAVEAAADYQMAAAAFETMTGSAARGKALLDSLQAFAVSTPFGSKEAIDAARTLMGMGVASENLLPVMRALGDMAGGDAERFSRLALAYSQTQAAGRLMGQDLNQFTQAGVGAADFAETMKVSVGQFLALKEAGQVSAGVVTRTLNRMTAEGGRFAGGMERASRTVQGQFNAMRESATIALQNLGLKAFDELKVANALGGLADGITATLGKAAEKSGPLFRQIRETGVVAFAAVKAEVAATLALFSGGGLVTAESGFRMLRNAIVNIGLAAAFTKDMTKDAVLWLMRMPGTGQALAAAGAWLTADPTDRLANAERAGGSMAAFAREYRTAMEAANRALDGQAQTAARLNTTIADTTLLFQKEKDYAEQITAAFAQGQTPYQKFRKEMELLRVNNLFGEAGGFAARGAVTQGLARAFGELEAAVKHTAVALPQAAVRNTAAAESVLARAGARGAAGSVQERIKGVLERALEEHRQTQRNTRDTARALRELLAAGEGF